MPEETIPKMLTQHLFDHINSPNTSKTLSLSWASKRDQCVQIIHDIKIDLENKNGTAKILGKKNEVGTEDVRIQFRNLLIDGQGRLHEYYQRYV